jgi:hypothetical protein
MGLSGVESKDRRERREAKRRGEARIAEAHRDLVNAKIGLRAEIERQFREKLFALEYKQSYVANEELKNGVSKSAVGRAIGNTSWDAITACLAIAGEEFAPEVAVGGRFFFANEDGTVAVKWDGYTSDMEFPFLHDREGHTDQDGYNADLDMTVVRNANGAWIVLDHGNNVVKLFDGTVTRPSHGLVKGDLDESEAALPGAKLGRLLTEWEATR